VSRALALAAVLAAALAALAALFAGRARSAGEAVSYRLALPGQILARPDGTLLVVERQTRNRVVRVSPRTGAVTVFSARVPAPWGLAAGAGGRVLVSSASGIYSLRGAGAPATRIAAFPAGPIAQARSGDVYFADGSTLGVMRPGTRTPVTLSRDVSSPHGLLAEPAGTLVVSDTGHGRLLRFDPARRTTEVLAEGLENALGAIRGPQGSILVVEFASGRLLRIADVRTTVVTDSLRKPYALTRARDGSVYVVEDGDLWRPTGGIARVAADGTITRLRLIAR
jgi:sugar lactone lactonase YvrE